MRDYLLMWICVKENLVVLGSTGFDERMGRYRNFCIVTV
jgi:hypothetical protein